MTPQQENFEHELLELQEIVVGERPSNKYEFGFRDGIQHAISVSRGVLDE